MASVKMEAQMTNYKKLIRVDKIAAALAVAMSLYASVAMSQTNFSAAIEKVEKSVVVIKGDNGLGSGFIISTDGKIATNLHVIQNMVKGGVQLNSGEIFDSFTVLGVDARRDLAVIKIGGFNLPALELGNSDLVKVGEPIAVVGSPRGLTGTVTAGVLSAIRAEDGVKLLQIDAAVNPGNSGGPVVRADGVVIGVVVSKLAGSENVNFAVPINSLRGLLGNLAQPMTLTQLRESLKDQTDVFKSKQDNFPKEWKSLTTGSSRRLSISNDSITGENHLKADEVKNGFYVRWDIKKIGDKWGGKSYDGGPCLAPAGFFPSKWYWRNTVLDVELLLVTPNRIEGRIHAPTGKLECSTGKWDGPFEWMSFIWVPVN
jgi:hypothetical protein